MYDLTPSLLALALLACTAPPLRAQSEAPGEYGGPSIDSLLSIHEDLHQTRRRDPEKRNAQGWSREKALRGARIDPGILVYPDSIVDPAMIREPRQGVDPGIFLPSDSTSPGS